MADLTKAEKEAAAVEARRREALTEEERNQEDLAALESKMAAENATKGIGSVSSPAMQRAALVARMQREAKAYRDKQATVEVTVARGRHVFLNADQAEGFGGGATIMVTPDEEVALRRAGHLVNPDGLVTEPAGPRVYQEAGLLQGHAAGQSQDASGKSTANKPGK